MPAKKVAKKVAKKTTKKAAKKMAKKHAGHGHEDDLRRAYEHLGRLEALQGAITSAVVKDISDLTELARVTLLTGDTKSTAELLRACEHLAFGSLASTTKEAPIGDALQDAIAARYERLIEHAAERWDEQETEPTELMTRAYEGAFDRAEQAYAKGAFRRALELARAADALSHVHIAGELELSDGGKGGKRRLKG